MNIKPVYLSFLFLLMATSVPAQLNLTSGGHLVVKGETKIVLKDLDWDQDGTFNPDQGMVIMRGTNISEIKGSLANFYQLNLDKTGTEVRLQTPVSISKVLLFTDGMLDLNGWPVDLGSTGRLINEAESNRAYSSSAGGTIIREAILNIPVAADSGGLGLSLSSSSNLGLTTLIRGHDPQTFPNGSSISRYFDISPANNSGLNATLRFSYFDAELNGHPEGDLELFLSQNSGSTWNPAGFATRDAANNFIEQNGINQMGRWTLTTLATFPVEWLSFEVVALDDQHALLKWVTGSETNNRGFDIEHAAQTGLNPRWESIGFVEGAGTSDSPTAYRFIDPLAYSGENLYRLRQIDFNGGVNYSEVRSVWFGEDFSLSLFPNPTQDLINIRFMGIDQDVQAGRYELFDPRGRAIQGGTLESGAILQLSLTELPEGVYLIRIFINGRTILKRIGKVN